MNQVVRTIGLAALGGAITLGAYIGLVQEPNQVLVQQNAASTPIIRALNQVLQVSDFSQAAENSVNSVVNVSVAIERRRSPWEEYFYGGANSGQPQYDEGTGSGVIVSQDGYIVTNNHVIQNAKKIKVRLNDNTTLSAELIGADATTDIALLKIEGENYSPLSFGNSDDLRLGEWVLAVGNPFNLTSTVTAGIISAKGRSINIINDRSAIESFIQTDAAVNPGNSGGALVNTRGELIGINTAISTHTGSYEGYSFAVPSNIVSKVVADLRKYGAVQRAFLGVNITDVSSDLAAEQNLKTKTGVYVIDVVADGAAEESGIKKGDVIVKIDGNSVTKTSELLEQIGRKRPGDLAEVSVFRGNEERLIKTTLKNQQGTTELFSKEDIVTEEMLGGKFEALSAAEKQKWNLRSGVKVADVGNGKLKKAGVPNDFIIVRVNNQTITSVEMLNNLLKSLNKGDGVLIQGYRPNGQADYFAFGM